MSAEKFIASRELQGLLRDKDSGLPLSNGFIIFKKDADRLTDKPVFRFSGSPGNPAFTVLPNPLTLNGAGMTADPNNDAPIPIYYFPFDEDGLVELYFIEIFSQAGELQNSLEAWPPGFTEGTGGTVITENFVPNPSFNLFNPNEIINGVEAKAGELTPVAYGGWFYELTAGSTSVINVNFEVLAIEPIPQGNPQFNAHVEVETNDPSDQERDFTLIFKPENIFASTDEFTFSFFGRSGGGTETLTLILQKNYGSGGSPTTNTILTTFDLQPTDAQFVHTFSFGEESGKTKGTGNNDVRLILRSSLTTAADYFATTFILAPGLISLPLLAATTDRQSLAQSIAGGAELPAGDGSNLFLPLILTKTGIGYDDSEVGFISANVASTIPPSYLECNGQQLEVFGKSGEGIPFSRLFNKIGILFGAGDEYYIAESMQSNMQIFNSTPGTVTAIADGAIATGFTFQTTFTGNTTFDFFGGKNRFASPSTLIVGTNGFGLHFAAIFGAGTSPVTVGLLDPLYDSKTDISGNSRFIYQLSGFSSAIANYQGKYFLIANITTNFYVWYQIDGVGVDPAPGGTGIKIDLNSVDDETEIGNKTIAALKGNATFSITTTAGGTINPGSSVVFFSPNGNEYEAWFSIDGTGSAPTQVAQRRIFEVALLSADSANTVAAKFRDEVNKQYFGVPSLEGQFLRGTSPSGEFDDPLAFVHRFNPFQTVIQNSAFIASKEYPIIQSHQHKYFDQTTNSLIGSGTSFPGFPTLVSTLNTGNKDTNPINTGVQWLIKY